MKPEKHIMLMGLVLMPRILLVFITVLVIRNYSPDAPSLELFTSLHDGAEYKLYAQSIRTLDLRALPTSATRFLPGYPLALALVSYLPGITLAGLFVPLVFSLLAVWGFETLFKNKTLSMYFAVCPPAWILFTTTNMSEGMFVVLSLFSLIFFTRQRYYAAAFLLGYAHIVRPVALLLFLPMLIVMSLENSWKKVFTSVLIFLVIPVLSAVLQKIYFGSSIHNVKMYLSCDFALTLPFSSIINATISPDISLIKKLYVWAVIALSLLAFGTLMKQYLATRTSFDFLLLLWLGLSLLFYLALASKWTFFCIDRFILTCLPAIMYGLRKMLPRNNGIIAGIILSLAICVYWNVNMIKALDIDYLLSITGH